MANKIKYQGKIYIMESEVDEQIKANVLEKVEETIGEIFDDGSEGSEGSSLPPQDLPPQDLPPTDGTDPELPMDETVDTASNPNIDTAMASVEDILGINLDESGRAILSNVLTEIMASANESTTGAPSVDPTPALTEAPNTILHEGRVYRKVGKVENLKKTTLKESAEKPAPKNIRVKGQVFTLSESQDLRNFKKK